MRIKSQPNPHQPYLSFVHQIPSDWEISYDIWKNLEESVSKSVILPSQPKKRRLKLKLIPKKQHIQTALTEIFLENNIKNREDLKMFCCRGGVKGQKAIYDKVYELLPPLRGNIEYSEKKTIKLVSLSKYASVKM